MNFTPADITTGMKYTYTMTGKTGVVAPGDTLHPDECNVELYDRTGRYQTLALAIDRATIADHLNSGIYAPDPTIDPNSTTRLPDGKAD